MISGKTQWPLARWFCVIVAMFFHSCLLAATLSVASPDGNFMVPVTSLKASKFKSTLKQQFDFSCGSAAVATLLTHHYGYPISEQEVFENMFSRGDQQRIRREGFSLWDMKRFIESLGFRADGFEQPLEKLGMAKLPAIVLISEKGYHHFVVVKGLHGERILLGDPASGTRAMSRRHFESIWVNNLLFVIHSQQTMVKFNEPVDWSAAPGAPLNQVDSHDQIHVVSLPKFGPGDF